MPSASRSSGVCRLRAPRKPRRMLGAVRLAAAEDPSPRVEVVVRVAVPDRIVRMFEFGLSGLSDSSRGWWQHVEREGFLGPDDFCCAFATFSSVISDINPSHWPETLTIFGRLMALIKTVHSLDTTLPIAGYLKPPGAWKLETSLWADSHNTVRKTSCV